MILKGYSFRFSKEAADYAVEKDFVPFIWRRNKKDDDAKGMEEQGNGESSLNDPPKSADGDTPMPQVNTTGPGASTMGLMEGSVVLHGIAVTPFNKNPQTPRGKEIVAHQSSSSSPTRIAGIFSRATVEQRTVDAPKLLFQESTQEKISRPGLGRYAPDRPTCRPASWAHCVPRMCLRRWQACGRLGRLIQAM